MSNSYYEDASVSYASASWVHEVAEKVAEVMHTYRPFTRDDIIVDYGCGPGVTLERIFYINQTMKNADHNQAVATAISPVPLTDSHSGLVENSGDLLLGKHARICDISQSFVSMSRQLATIRCPLKGVWCEWLNAFESSQSAAVSEVFKTWLPEHIDVAYSSLVAEYLSFDQIVELSKVILDRLEDAGLLAWFDWCEHPPYPERHSAGIHHPKGLKKSEWAKLTSALVDYVEEPTERLETHSASSSPESFLPLPQWRLEVQMGSFDVVCANEQSVTSGNAVHYVLLKKCITKANTVFRKAIVARE